MDHLGKEHRVSDSSPAKQSRLVATLQRKKYIDDFDPRFKDFGLNEAPLYIGQRRSQSMMLPNTLNIRERIPLPTGTLGVPPFVTPAV